MPRKPSADKWDAANMAYQTIKVRKTLLDSFKTACADKGLKVNTVLREAIEDFVAANLPQQPKRSRYPKTEEQRQRYNAYQREYRRRNPEKAKRWQQDYIVRKAEKLAKAKEE